MKLKTYILPAFMSVGLVAGTAACDPDTGTKEIVGTAAGGALGGYLGSKVGSGSGRLAATAAGAIAGAMLGSHIGRQLDQADRQRLAETHQTAMERYPDGRTATWSNPNSGHSGTVTPTETYADRPGGPCREYRTTVNIGGRVEEAYGTACRQPDGTWKIVN